MADRLMAGTMIALSLVLLVVVSNYRPHLSYEPIGPRAFPMGLLSAIVLVSLGIFLTARPAADPDGGTGHVWRVTVAALVLLGYALVFEPLGYLISTFLVTVGIALLARGRPLAAVLCGVGTSVLCYQLFAWVLHVNLPLGNWTFG